MVRENHRIYLSPPHMSGRELKYINKAFSENWIAPLGPNVDAFERAISRYCHVDHVVALSSGTAAIHIALILLGVRSGDEVVASSFTFSGTINPITYLGATPILVDSESDTWNMDPVLLETAIKQRMSKGKKPAAIIIVHLYGMPAKIMEILEISSHYDIPVIEDAAESIGSRYMDKPVGSFGTLSIFSFNGNKIITTSGGGALASPDEELIRKARFLSAQAKDAAPHYQHSEIGYNYRMSNILAGIGLGQMEMIDEMVQKRRENYTYYRDHFDKIDGISFLNEPDKRFYSNRWLTTILIDESATGFSRTMAQNALEKKNIESRPLWKPMHLQPVFSSCPAYLNGVSEELFRTGLCLPSGSGMTNEDKERVIDGVLGLL